MVSICWCTIHTSDLEASKSFYIEALGMEEEDSFSPGPGRMIVFLKGENGAKIELIYTENEMIPLCDRYLSIGFITKNLDTMVQRMNRNQVKMIRGPIILGSTRCFFVKDPNGVEIQIVEQ